MNDQSTAPLEVLSRDEIDELPDPEWLIEGLFNTHSSVVLFGPSGVGKTIFALGMAVSIATEVTQATEKRFLGRPVRSGTVVYLTPEGLSGLAARITAWEAVLKYAKASRFHLIHEGPSLTDPGAARRVIKALHERGITDVTLLVIDTLACHIGDKDESRAPDMNLLINTLKQIRAELNCSTVLIHHTGWDGREQSQSGTSKMRERGSYALRASADTVIALEPHNGVIRVRCVKQKESNQFDTFYVKLVTSHVERRQKEVSTCIAELTTLSAPDLSRLKNSNALTNNQRAVLGTFNGDMTLGLRYIDLLERSKVPKGSIDKVLVTLKNSALIKYDEEHKTYSLTETGGTAVEQHQ